MEIDSILDTVENLNKYLVIQQTEFADIAILGITT